MNSQNYECTVGEQDALAQANRRIADLQRRRAEIADRRRELAEPTHKVVVAHPSGMHHKITLGGVLVRAGFQAADADALAGLFAIGAADFAERVRMASQGRPEAQAGEIIAHVIDAHARELTGLGLLAAWRSRLAVYLEDREDWLARDDEFRLEGAWRNAAMTADQRWLIRVTCRVVKISMPGHLLRGQAADWLESHGANLNYGDFL